MRGPPPPSRRATGHGPRATGHTDSGETGGLWGCGAVGLWVWGCGGVGVWGCGGVGVWGLWGCGGCANLGGGGGLEDPPTQNLGKPRDPDLSHPHSGRGGGLLDSQPPTHPPSQSATKPVQKQRALDQWCRLCSNCCWLCNILRSGLCSTLSGSLGSLCTTLHQSCN